MGHKEMVSTAFWVAVYVEVASAAHPNIWVFCRTRYLYQRLSFVRLRFSVTFCSFNLFPVVTLVVILSHYIIVVLMSLIPAYYYRLIWSLSVRLVVLFVHKHRCANSPHHKLITLLVQEMRAFCHFDAKPILISHWSFGVDRQNQFHSFGITPPRSISFTQTLFISACETRTGTHVHAYGDLGVCGKTAAGLISYCIHFL